MKSVRELGPGAAMVVRRGRIVCRWLWYGLPAFRVHQRQMPEADALRATEVALRTAVYRQMVSDVLVEAFLSAEVAYRVEDVSYRSVWCKEVGK